MAGGFDEPGNLSLTVTDVTVRVPECAVCFGVWDRRGLRSLFPGNLEYKAFAAMATVISLLAALALALPTPPIVRHGQLQLAVTGGTVYERSGGSIAIWANSPEVRISVVNTAQGFYNGNLRWLNVPAGSYLVSGRGVAEAAASSGGILVSPLSLAGGGRSAWKLESGIPKDYRFAVASSIKGGLKQLPRTAGDKPHFSLTLGGTGVNSAMDLAASLDFPAYLLPGLFDGKGLVRQRLGTPYSAFAVGGDRFLLLDNRANVLGKEQLDWVGKRLQEYRLDGARRVFVFMHRPPVDPRRNVRNGLSNKVESRRLARLLKTVPTAAIFAGQINRSYTKTWYGIKTYMLTDRDVMVVESKANDLSIRLPIH